MANEKLWQTKLAARIHDPAEKALVLLRDPAGHEGGTSRALKRLLGFGEITADTIEPDNAEALSTVLFEKGLPRDIYLKVQRADRWAAAADRPQWPMEEITVTTKTGERKTLKVADWAQVRWTKQPVLIHPLTGDRFDLGQHGGLSDTDMQDIKRRSLEHFSRLLTTLAKQDAEQDWKKILLAYWRFGPELIKEEENYDKLGELWRLLPADTRVPDHSIWDHLDLASAFAGAFAADPEGEAALLALSIGPVQSFIAAARSTSDLWAGSHLLARLAWEAMKPVCEALGPDAILFPRLRGVPQVDLWLRDECGLTHDLFMGCDWTKGGTDSNPLFSAALPNRFVAVIPRSRAESLAREVETRVRQWLQDQGRKVVDRLLETAGLATDGEQYCHQQMREQLAGFPEVHWAVVPFSLVRVRDAAKQTDLEVTALSEAMAPYFGVSPGQPCGFLDTPAWKALQDGVAFNDGTVFFAPNPGVLYPAVYDLAERVLAAAKSVRAFDQTEQRGWRCALTGETEWLTTDPEQLKRSYRKQTDTLWARIAARKPAWAKGGEHLGALPAIKRLWPTLFAEEVQRAVGGDVQRFVVSTHTMALAQQLNRWLDHGGLTADEFGYTCKHHDPEEVAMPRRLIRRHWDNPALKDAKRIVGLLDMAQELEDEREADRLRRIVRRTLARSQGDDKDEIRLETYYALLLMDGDHMGRILSGEDERSTITYRASFHPQVQQGFDKHAEKHPLIRRYGEQKRALAPNRHLAISGALNDFSLTVVRHVVEEEHLGRVIYAGGDDVLAMLPVADLLSAMQQLRHAYSGTVSEDENVDWGELRKRDTLVCKGGFAYLRGRLMRMMGRNATASCGAVIAHHQAPLGAVLRELREAERRAKNEGGRDAFALAIVKRSGGALHLTAKWGEPVELLSSLRNFLADKGVSRRAVYHCMEWLKDLPEPVEDRAMLESMLAYQFDRQADQMAKIRHDVPNLARQLAALTMAREKEQLKWLSNFLSVAEFLARETRTGGDA